jgi:hypothetical protein
MGAPEPSFEDENEQSAAAGPPSWLSGAFRSVRDELRLFLATVVAVSLRPAAFAADWRDRRRKALNPLAFLGTALAFSSPPTLMVSHFGGLQDGGGSLWDAFLSDQVAPYVQYVLLGILAHGFLRLLRGGSQKLLATVGIALYAGGGPAMLVDLLTLPIDVGLARVAASADTLTNVVLQGLAVASIMAANVAFFVTFALGLGGLHRVRPWRPALALSLAYLLLVGVRIAFFKLIAAG